VNRGLRAISKCAIAPNTWKTSSPAAELVSILSTKLSRAHAALLGRIERTLFMLDWLESPELRRRCHAGLNKNEQRHSLAQVICTFKQGRIADRGAEAQQFRASGLNLVIARSCSGTPPTSPMPSPIGGGRRAGPRCMARPYVTAQLGAHQPVRRFPVGSRRSNRRKAPVAQFRSRQNCSVNLIVLGPFDLSVDRFYQPKTAICWKYEVLHQIIGASRGGGF
jgi:hypothetical protein